MNFAKVFGRAVQRRTYPNTGLHLAQLAHAISCSEETLKNAIRAQHSTSSRIVASCIDYFTRCGDHTFIQELYPNAVTPLVQRTHKAERALAFVESFRDVLSEGAAA